MSHILQELSFGLHQEVESLSVLAQNAEWFCQREITKAKYVLRPFGEISTETAAQMNFLGTF